MNRARELAILTSAHSQQVAIIDISTSLSGVPLCAYKRHFYPISLALGPKLSRLVCVLALLSFPWN
jgi:hypothetical protein